MTNMYSRSAAILALTTILSPLSGVLRLSGGARESRSEEESARKSSATHSGPRSLAASKATTARTFGSVPLQFEANRGQSDPQVQFISRGGGYSLFLTPTDAVIILSNRKPAESGTREQSPRRLHMAERGAIQFSIVRMKLLGGNPIPQIQGTNRLAGTVNYFIGGEREKWKTGIPTYSAVEYTAVYPGIDLVFYGNQHQLEYDFVLKPGADPRNIALDFE